MAVGAPLSEELLFRGFLLGALAKSLEKGLSVPTALLLRSFPGALARRRLRLLAGRVHLRPLGARCTTATLSGLAEVFAIGLFLSWLLWRTGSLWVTIFCHAAYNGAIVLALPAGLADRALPRGRLARQFRGRAARGSYLPSAPLGGGENCTTLHA